MATDALPTPEPMLASVHAETYNIPKTTAVKMFLRRNQNTIILLGAAAGMLWVNRILIRRDIKHINFTAEFYPDWMYDDEGSFVGIGSD